MVVIEIFTGNVPFYPYSDDQVIARLMRDKRPNKPVHGDFTSKMWTLTKECWNKDPQKRLEISDVLRKLESRGENNRFTLLLPSLGALFGSRTSLQRLDTDHQG